MFREDLSCNGFQDSCPYQKYSRELRRSACSLLIFGTRFAKNDTQSFLRSLPRYDRFDMPPSLFAYLFIRTRVLYHNSFGLSSAILKNQRLFVAYPSATPRMD